MNLFGLWQFTLIVLSRLREEKRLDTNQVAAVIQKDDAAARAVLERLVEADLLEAHGVKKGRTWTLSAKVYRHTGKQSDYVRQAGFDSLQQEQMVLKYVRSHGQIRRQDVMELCKLGPDQATRLLKKLTTQGKLQKIGERKGTVYEQGHGL